jgi:hypothetical protein
MTWLRPLLVVAVGAALLPLSGAVSADGDCEWLAGDLHIHTTYSHDSYGGPADDNTGPEELYTLGHPVASQFGVAATRDLDFLAITDHNDIRSQTDPGFGAFGVIPVSGYENSLRGHAQMLGARRIYNNDDQNAAAVQALADELRADGGVFQINHPADGSTDFPHDQDWSYGKTIVPDTLELWNISRLYQPPLPSASSNDDATRLWESFLDAGQRVAATGGSDNHYVATTPIQGAGQPTTWVCSPGRSEEGVLEGLRAGHTFISHQPPGLGGPSVFLEGDGDADGDFEAIVGDDVPPGSALRVRVDGAPGSFLRLVTTGGTELGEPIPVTSPSFTYNFTAPDAATWVRAEIFEPDLASEREAACDPLLGGDTTYCRNYLLTLGMTSAIFLVEPQAGFDPTTTITYVGDTSGKVGSTATFAATLTGSDGPIADAVLTFVYRGQSHVATTDGTGTASTQVRLTGPPGPSELTVGYSGSDRYSPSSYSVTFTVTTGP